MLSFQKAQIVYERHGLLRAIASWIEGTAPCEPDGASSPIRQAEHRRGRAEVSGDFKELDIEAHAMLLGPAWKRLLTDYRDCFAIAAVEGMGSTTSLCSAIAGTQSDVRREVRDLPQGDSNTRTSRFARMR